MTELVKRAADVVGRATNSGFIAPGVAALCELAGVVVNAPPGVGTAIGLAAGATVGSVAEEMVDVAAQAMQHRASRIERFVESISEETDEALEELLAQAIASPELLEVLARTAETASRSLDEWKIDLLARIFVSSTRDNATVDSALILTDAIRQLEAPHVRLLALLAKRKPDRYRPFPDSTAPNLEDLRWSMRSILQEDPGLRGVYEALVGKLSSLGLIVNTTHSSVTAPALNVRWKLTDLGQMCARHLKDRAAGSGGWATPAAV